VFGVVTRAILIGSKYAPNRSAAGASPQTPLGDLTALPQTLSLVGGGEMRGRDGRGRRGRTGKEGREVASS